MFHIDRPKTSNKETSRWDEAKDWEGVCIPYASS